MKSAEEGLADFPDSASEWHWRFLTLKSEILMRQGHNEESLSLLQQNLPAQFSESDSAVWQNLTRGSAFTYSEKYPEAEHALHSAQSLANSAQPQLTGEVLLRLGTLASLRWNLDTAQSFYRQCLQFARDRSDHFLEASALGSLGLVAARMGHNGESIDWNKQALELDLSQNLLGLATKAEGNIGWNYYLVGDFESALNQYQQAIQDALRAHQEQDHALWLLNSGTVFYDKRDFASAEKTSLQALELAENLNDPANKIYAKQNLALISVATGKLPEAQQYVDDCLRLEGANPDRRRQLYSRLIDAQIALLKNDFSKAEKSFSSITGDSSASVSMRWESQAGTAQVHAAQGNFGLAEKEYAQSINTIAEAQKSIEREEFRLSFLSSAIRFYDQYVNFLIAQNRPLDALQIADLSRAQTLERGLSPSSGTIAKPSAPTTFRPQEIARRQNATLLFYWVGQNRSYLWVVTPAKVASFSLPARDEIDSAASAYRKSFLDPRDPFESGGSSGKKLYDVLVRPAEKLIPKNSRVIILPDGSLTGLNFETLIVAGPQPHYWIEDVTVSIANSLSLLARSRRAPSPKSPNLLFFGDALSASKEFPVLADAGQEADALRKYFAPGRIKFITGAGAIPSAYLTSKPGNYSFIHFATHGTASLTRPLESAIILSPGGGSFKLYARDIVGEPLNAYLVSISACDAAGNRVLAGEGLVGLSWAFLRAGAHNVVAGLWEVSTASSPQIMDDLYKGITSGQDPATALRNAKLSLVHSKGAYHRPFYWAPFQLYSGS